MANALFDAGREAFLTGAVNWAADDIKLIFVDHADDTPDVGVDDNLDDITGAAVVATSDNFAGKTTADGVADAADVTVTGVTGDEFESIVIYKDSGVSSTSTLIGYIDSATGLPFTPTGGDITVVWSSGASKIFKL